MGKPRVCRGDFADAENYYRTLLEAGGPDFDETYAFPGGTGYYGNVLNATYASSREELREADAQALTLEQTRRPHVFVRKLASGRRWKRKG